MAKKPSAEPIIIIFLFSYPFLTYNCEVASLSHINYDSAKGKKATATIEQSDTLIIINRQNRPHMVTCEHKDLVTLFENVKNPHVLYYIQSFDEVLDISEL